MPPGMLRFICDSGRSPLRIHVLKEETVKGRTYTSTIIALFLSLTLCLLAVGQEELPESYVVDDLQLISLGSVPDWENDWEYSRAVEAATILAWLHDHGYPSLLDDLNEDGVIDELDTIELADRLGKNPMGCEQPRRPTDAWLVIGLAEYVADKYPDIFELKIYDRGFTAEFDRKMGRSFAPDAIPGIILTLESEPTFCFVHEGACGRRGCDSRLGGRAGAEHLLCRALIPEGAHRSQHPRYRPCLAGGGIGTHRGHRARCWRHVPVRRTPSMLTIRANG